MCFYKIGEALFSLASSIYDASNLLCTHSLEGIQQGTSSLPTNPTNRRAVGVKRMFRWKSNKYEVARSKSKLVGNMNLAVQHVDDVIVLVVKRIVNV